MRLALASALFGFSTAQAAPPSGGASQLLPILVAILTGVFGTAGFNWYKYRKQAAREDDSLIAQATKQAVEAATAMIGEYRKELLHAKEELREIQGQLREANERITRLERDLEHAEEDRAALQDELGRAVQRREVMATELERVRERMSELEAIVGGEQSSS